jgi:hypothetical protein
VSQTVTYKGHRIRAVALPVEESKDGARAAQALIRVPLPSGHSREQALGDPDDRTFATHEDAEGYALHLGVRWIDRPGA